MPFLAQSVSYSSTAGVRAVSKWKGSFPIFNFPFSIADISNTSFKILSSNFEAPSILSKFPKTFSSSVACFVRLVMPRIAFIGVRISWDILDKKIVFASFARFLSSKCIRITTIPITNDKISATTKIPTITWAFFSIRETFALTNSAFFGSCVFMIW